MSTWTIVCGLIRLHRLDKTTPIPDFGTIINPADKRYKWETTLPMGSEGSLRYKIILEDSVDKLENCTASNDEVGVAIFGSLRDFEGDQLQEIVKWVKFTFCRDKLWENRISMIQGILSIECMDGNFITVRYHDDQWEIL